MAQLYPILHDLVNTTFFRMFRVNLKNPQCPFWKAPEQEKEKEKEGSCTGGHDTKFAPFMQAASPFSTPFGAEEPPPPCSVDAEEEGGADTTPMADLSGDDDVLDRTMTVDERLASEERDNETDASCEFEEDLPTYWVDMCSGDSSNGDDYEDVNLIKNAERNTGYNGSHIWEAMYSENCFEVGNSLPRGRFGSGHSMCYEERVLYRLLSGWHASTSIAIFKNFYAPGTKMKGRWAPNPDRYMEAFGKHPDRIKNLHFSFVVILRAIKKAAPFLLVNKYITGNGEDEKMTRNLMTRLLDSQVLSVCSPLFDAFDETQLFQITSADQRTQLKRQFKNVFQNITVLVDCVQCQRCRLHAKLFSLGLGSALKILLTPMELVSSSTSRDEVVALINVLQKLSESMEDAKELTHLYWRQHESELATVAKVETAPAGPPLAQKVAATTTEHSPVKPAPQVTSVPVPLTRTEQLDAAIGAVRAASHKGTLTVDGESVALRSLMVPPVNEDLLLLAKHYAAEQPDLFASIALEVAVRGPAHAGKAVAANVAGAPAPVPDVIIIGGGLAGMVTAVSMLDRGANIILVDKQPYLGGNSGKASSGINAALETSVESLIADTTKSAGKLARKELIVPLANRSAEAVAWLRDRTNVDLSMRSQLGGHTVKRTLRPSNGFVGAEVTFAIGELLKRLAKDEPNRCQILLKTKWKGLARDSSGWNVIVETDSAEKTLRAPSVVISSGGFGRDREEQESFMRRHRPDLQDFSATLGPQTTGDGLRIARDIGARLVDMDKVQLHPTGFVDPAKRDDKTKTLAAELLRGVGGLILDRAGERFTDELGTRQAVVSAMLGRSDSNTEASRTFWLVLNGKAAKMADRHATLYSKKGLLKIVQGLSELATHLKVPEQRLNETFEEYNRGAIAGQGPFGRKVFPDGHWPIERDETFYVGEVTPVIHYTMGGIAIDSDGRVLADADGQTIPGLYAIGEASGGVHGDNRLAGNSLMECTVFGRHVGTTLPISKRSDPALEVAPQAAAPQVAPPQVAPPQTEAPASGAPAGRKITLEELAEHNTIEQKSWVALYGQVYDLTEYVEEHPGGAEAILDVAGTEATEHFETVHNRELLDSMGFTPIGELAM